MSVDSVCRLTPGIHEGENCESKKKAHRQGLHAQKSIENVCRPQARRGARCIQAWQVSKLSSIKISTWAGPLPHYPALSPCPESSTNEKAKPDYRQKSGTIARVHSESSQNLTSGND